MVTTHEVLHSMHSGQESSLVIKRDYEIAFDMVNLDLLVEIFKLPKWALDLINTQMAHYL